MRRSRSRRADRWAVGRICLRGAPIIVMLLSSIASAEQVFAAPGLPAADQPSIVGGGSAMAALAISVNGQPTDMVVPAKVARGRIWLRATDLRALRIRADQGDTKDDFVALDTIEGLSYRYDADSQSLVLTVVDSARIMYVADADAQRHNVAEPLLSTPLNALVVNYGLYGASEGGLHGGAYGSGTAYARLTTGFGTLLTGGVFQTDPVFAGSNILRLDTAWQYRDDQSVRSYTLGDFTTGAVSWSKSYRLTGLQIASDFERRPDLIVAAVPSLSGSVAVPSSVDLYVNNLKVYSGAVPAGPFTLSHLPALASGDLHLVATNAMGQQNLVDTSFYYTPSVLQPGVFDYSLEAGFPRFGYGTVSNLYGSDPALTATLRYGWLGGITVEGHGEATRGLTNIGFGFDRSFFGIGSLGLAANASTFNGRAGGKYTARWSMALSDILSGYVSTERTFGRYYDLSSVAVLRSNLFGGQKNEITFQPATSWRIDRAGLSIQVPFDRRTAIGFGYSGVREGDIDQHMANLSISRPLGRGLGVSVYAYKDFGRNGDIGFHLDLNIRLGGGIHATAGVQSGQGQNYTDVQFAGSGHAWDGTASWTALDREGGSGAPYRRASVSYHDDSATVAAGLEQQDHAARVTLGVNGALVTAAGGVYATDQVGDGFAVVTHAGAGVSVRRNGAKVAKTAADGSALVPMIEPYRNTVITLDPTNLPLGWQTDGTERNVVTGYREGTAADFGAKPVADAIVIFTDQAGKFLPVGAKVQEEDGSSSIIGYDGEVYLKELGAANRVRIDMGSEACTAAFSYQLVPGTLPRIGPIACMAG